MDTMGANRTDATPEAPASSATGVVVASSASDAAAVEAVEMHHGELAGALAAHVEALLNAVGGVGGSGVGAVEKARGSLVGFCTGELLPHAVAEEGSLYPAAARDERARLLVEAMVAEHRVLEALVEEVRTVDGPVRAAGAASALQALFAVHLTKENDLILPLVAADPNVSLSEVLGDMHELLGHGGRDGHDAGAPESAGGCGGACGCGGDVEADVSPVLDVREVPHAIRHATVFGAVEAVGAGDSLVLVAPHDPLPLLGQLEDRAPGAFSVTYEERGPRAWRLRLTRSR